MRGMRGVRLGWRLVGAILLGLIAKTQAENGPPQAPSRLSIATYNLANYNLTDRTIEGAFLTQYPKPEREKAALRRVLRELDADVLALQEIGGEPFLRELRRDLRSEGLDYAHGTVLAAADPARRVAVLSRLPLARVIEHTDLEFAYFEGRERVKRGLLEVHINTSAGELALFVVHLKSKWTERRDDPEAELRRDREATLVRDRILTQFPEPATARFVIAGDLNAGPTERAYRALTERGPLQVSAAVPAMDSRGETWTHRYRRADLYSRVDFILVSPGLLPAVVGGAGQILDTPSVPRASDHRPVKVELEFAAGPES